MTHILQFKTAAVAQDFSEAEVFIYEGYKLNRKLHRGNGSDREDRSDIEIITNISSPLVLVKNLPAKFFKVSEHFKDFE